MELVHMSCSVISMNEASEGLLSVNDWSVNMYNTCLLSEA